MYVPRSKVLWFTHIAFLYFPVVNFNLAISLATQNSQNTKLYFVSTNLILSMILCSWGIEYNNVTSTVKIKYSTCY